MTRSNVTQYHAQGSQIAAQTDPFLTTSPLATQTKTNIKQHIGIFVTLESRQKSRLYEAKLP